MFDFIMKEYIELFDFFDIDKNNFEKKCKREILNEKDLEITKLFVDGVLRLKIIKKDYIVKNKNIIIYKYKALESVKRFY